MKKIFLFCALMVGGLVAPPIHAEVNLYGVANMPCGTWVKNVDSISAGTGSDIDTLSHTMDISWVQGFLSGFQLRGLREGRNLKAVDADSMEVFITNHCRKNPLHKLVVAATALAVELAK